MGFEPTTPTLARLCSTPELRPHLRARHDYRSARGLCKACLRAGRAASCAADAGRRRLTPEELFAASMRSGSSHRTYSHPPVFTVAEAAALRGSLPGGHCKSLFLKDKKGGFWLAVMLEERRIDLKKLAARLGGTALFVRRRRRSLRLLGVRAGQRDPFRPSQRCRAPRHPGARRRDAAITTRSITTR